MSASRDCPTFDWTYQCKLVQHDHQRRGTDPSQDGLSIKAGFDLLIALFEAGSEWTSCTRVRTHPLVCDRPGLRAIWNLQISEAARCHRVGSLAALRLLDLAWDDLLPVPSPTGRQTILAPGPFPAALMPLRA